MTNSGTFLGGMQDGEKWYYNEELAGKQVDEIIPYLDSKTFLSRVDRYNNSADYTVWLPTALHLDMDYNLSKGYYLNLSSMVALRPGSKAWSYGYYPSIAATPRYESRWFSAFLPLSYNFVSKMNIGAAARVGPLFVGTGSLVKALFTKSKQADFYFGLHLSGLAGNSERTRYIKEKRTKSRRLDCYKF